MIRVLAAATAVVLLAAPVAEAQARRPQSPMERCGNAGGPTIEVMSCMATDADRQDARLNRAYKAAMSRLRTPREKIALRDVQRAWIKDRDADCHVYLDEREYGRQGRIEAQDCFYNWTKDRADELERHGRPRPR
jgi:uncharacterized protein YecT (DUF1311 family)